MQKVQSICIVARNISSVLSQSLMQVSSVGMLETKVQSSASVALTAGTPAQSATHDGSLSCTKGKLHQLLHSATSSLDGSASH